MAPHKMAPPKLNPALIKKTKYRINTHCNHSKSLLKSHHFSSEKC